MSTPPRAYRVVVAMFFWLGFPEQTLRSILRDAGFAEAPSPPPIPAAAPGMPAVEISIGPVRRSLASYKSVKASWVPDKFMLELDGAVNDVLEAMGRIRASFEKHKYPLDRVCHYYEITFPPQPIDVDGFVEKLRPGLGVGMDLGGEELKPFSISLSNFDMPVTKERFYRWMHVTLNPDVNSPDRRAFVHTAKRGTGFDSVVESVKGIGAVTAKMKGFVEGA